MAESSRQGAKLVVAIGFIVIAVGIVLLRWRNTTDDIPNVYYLDLTDGQIFTAPTADPPVDAPGGPGQGVRAMLAGCGGCEPDRRQIVYLEKLGQQLPNGDRAVLLALPPDATGGEVLWHASTTLSGATIGNRIAEIKCEGDEKLVICEP